MRGEQQRFHRQATRLSKLSSGILQPLRYQDRHNRIGGRRRFMGDVGFQRRRVRSGQGLTPELFRRRIFERFPLQTDMLGEHGRRVDLGVDRRHIDAEAEQVVLHQLTHQVRDTPAVQNRVMEREDQIHTLIPHKRAQAVERRAVEVVAMRVPGGHVIPDKHIVGSGHDVERSWHP